jgi:hypothetical protein
MYAIARIVGAVIVLVLMTGTVLGKPLSEWVSSPVLALVARLGFLSAAFLLAYWILRSISLGWSFADVPLAPRAPVPDTRRISPEE